jgi:hypothetical protein
MVDLREIGILSLQIRHGLDQEIDHERAAPQVEKLLIRKYCLDQRFIVRAPGQDFSQPLFVEHIERRNLEARGVKKIPHQPAAQLSAKYLPRLLGESEILGTTG